MVVDVPEGMADGALQHEAAKASGVVAAGDGVSTASVMESTIAFMEGTGVVIFYLRM